MHTVTVQSRIKVNIYFHLICNSLISDIWPWVLLKGKAWTSDKFFPNCCLLLTSQATRKCIMYFPPLVQLWPFSAEKSCGGEALKKFSHFCNILLLSSINHCNCVGTQWMNQPGQFHHLHYLRRINFFLVASIGKEKTQSLIAMKLNKYWIKRLHKLC